MVSPSITVDALIDAAGLVSDVGGTARCAYVHPTDRTGLMKEKHQNGRAAPHARLLRTGILDGLRPTLWPTKGVAQGTALVADPTQIVVALRSDPNGGGVNGRDLHSGRCDLPRDCEGGRWRQ